MRHLSFEPRPRSTERHRFKPKLHQSIFPVPHVGYFSTNIIKKYSNKTLGEIDFLVNFVTRGAILVKAYLNIAYHLRNNCQKKLGLSK